MLWLKEEALTTGKVLGMVLGVLGLALVFGGGMSVKEGTISGLIALFMGVAAQSLGLVWLKRIGDDSPPLAMTLGILVVASPLFFIAWYLVDGHMPVAISERAIAATVYLGTFGSVLGFALYYYLIKHMEAGRIALITLITPVLALLLGHGLNQEEVLPQVWLGTGCILLGLCLHRWGTQWLGMLR
jgi:drug/metabolite transporter (DMT)-like permease